MSGSEALEAKSSPVESEQNNPESEGAGTNYLKVEPDSPKGESIAGLAKGSKPRGRPFAPGTSGNPSGRPKGARNKATIAAEALLDGEAESLTRKLVEKAKEGDVGALRFCLDRICPPRRGRLVTVEIPEIRSIEDAQQSRPRRLGGLHRRRDLNRRSCRPHGPHSKLRPSARERRN
jgi:Family of unknown function (DUF5681)